MFLRIFHDLCKQRGESPTSVCLKIGLSNAAYSSWNESSIPRRATLQKLADYFGVSVDYLLGKTDETKEKSTAKVSEEDIKVALFGGDKEVTDEMWNEVLDYAKYLKQKYNKS